ncbi:ABZJ_00895 family protein [Psychrobacter sp. CAL346-MNA-CIBAN-0220]|uniref:ABZJ_00895 family protein n=1 Tax=Psychrobacter sp. CAL346-MNA-CIBAN-0220 TaxID=3140457 RepID=UPI00332BE462
MARTKPNLGKHNAQSKYTGQPLKIRLIQYVGFFAIGYVLASAVFMMVQSQIGLNPQLVTAVSILAGAYIAVHKFIKHQQRALTKSEMNRLTLGGTSVVWLLTAIYFLALWLWLFDAASREVLLEMSAQQPMPLLFALVVISLLTLISARISIWAFNRLLDTKRKTS